MAGLEPQNDRTIPTGSNISNDAQTYTFASAQSKVLVQNYAASGATLYVRFNGTDALPASATSGDIELSAGDFVASPDGIHVLTVNIFSSATITFKTHYTVMGYP